MQGSVVNVKEHGIQVTSVEDGEAAVKAFEKDQFDLVLMDVQMPGVDGFEATAQIRVIEETRGGHVPIIALTAHAMKGYREKCLECGMDDYLAKPFAADTFYAALLRQLQEEEVD